MLEAPISAFQNSECKVRNVRNNYNLFITTLQILATIFSFIIIIIIIRITVIILSSKFGIQGREFRAAAGFFSKQDKFCQHETADPSGVWDLGFRVLGLGR